MNFKMILGLVVGAMILSGCTSNPPQRMEKFSYEPAYPTNIPQANLPKGGSLYHAGDSLSLFDATRAHKVGDIITIKLQEKFNAKKKDEAKYNKSNSQDYGVSTPLNLFGQTVVSPVSAPFAKGSPTGLGISYGSKGNFAGKSDVKQDSSLSGSIAVTVVKVIPNGNLVIRGEKWITIHDGDEVIRFAGIIRAQDIQPDNSINSEKVADVRLIYKDVGISGDTNRASALTKWMNKYWPI